MAMPEPRLLGGRALDMAMAGCSCQPAIFQARFQGESSGTERPFISTGADFAKSGSQEANADLPRAPYGTMEHTVLQSSKALSKLGTSINR